MIRAAGGAQCSWVRCVGRMTKVQESNQVSGQVSNTKTVLMDNSNNNHHNNINSNNIDTYVVEVIK